MSVARHGRFGVLAAKAALVGVYSLVCVLSLASVVSAATAPARPSQILHLPVVPDALFGDGGRVASSGAELELWSPLTGGRRKLSDPCDETVSNAALGTFGFAFDCVKNEGTDLDVNYSHQAWVVAPGGVEGVPVAGKTSRQGRLDIGINLRGAGAVAVFNSWVHGRPRLWRIVGTHARLIRADRNASVPMDVDKGRIVVLRADGALVFLGSNGRLLRVLPRQIGSGAVDVRLDERFLVIQRGSSLEIRNPLDGGLMRRLTMQHDRSSPWIRPLLFDVGAGLAVYQGSARSLRVVRLSDGRQAVVPLRTVSPDESVLPSAQLTAAGLFYADADAYKACDTCNDLRGRIVFVPRNQLIVS